MDDLWATTGDESAMTGDFHALTGDSNAMRGDSNARVDDNNGPAGEMWARAADEAAVMNVAMASSCSFLLFQSKTSSFKICFPFAIVNQKWGENHRHSFYFFLPNRHRNCESASSFFFQ